MTGSQKPSKENGIYVVQFPHPGTESMPSRVERKSTPIVRDYNKGKHKRKFMKAIGQTVDDNGTISEKKDLLFWGEWEPTSWAEPINPQGSCDPHWMHKPFLEINGTNTSQGIDEYANTDPFVFGDYFIYSNCRQMRTYKGQKVSSRLCSLQVGSVILFGSAMKVPFPHFALDTVFVVGESKQYVPRNYKKGLNAFIPENFERIMGFEQWPDEFIDLQFRCYHGVTADKPINGMYSFVPCKPYNGIHVRFPRVILTNRDFAAFGNIIIDKLSQNYHYTALDNISESKKIWDKVCQIVRQQGCERGVNFEYTLLNK